MTPPLEFLQGVWKGRGKGIYPTIKPFEYNEEISVTGNSGNARPVLHYRQRSWSRHTHPRPMHEETGWIRALVQTDDQGCQRCEWVLSAQNGVSTIEEGFVRDTTIYLHSTAITRSSTAKAPFAVEFIRTFEVDLTQDPPVLHYTMDMATTRTLMTRHLEAWLTRQPTDRYALLSSPSGLFSPGHSGSYMSPGQSGSYSHLSGQNSDGINGSQHVMMGSGSWPAGLSIGHPARSSASMPTVLVQSPPAGPSELGGYRQRMPDISLSGLRDESCGVLLQSQSLGDVATPTLGSGGHVLAQALLSFENGSSRQAMYEISPHPSEQPPTDIWGNGHGATHGAIHGPAANGGSMANGDVGRRGASMLTNALMLTNAESGGSTTGQPGESQQTDIVGPGMNGSRQNGLHHAAAQSSGTCPFLH